jgi:hypothetical protein
MTTTISCQCDDGDADNTTFHIEGDDDADNASNDVGDRRSLGATKGNFSAVIKQGAPM